MPFQLILVDPDPGMCLAWREAFAELPAVEIAENFFERLPAFDCMVSASNSFGLMDGGVDAAIVSFFGSDLMERVQDKILDHLLGEQSVGTSFIIPTHHPRHPYLAHTPTMRAPMEIVRTDNVYLAMWAMLLAVREHNQGTATKINAVACPGLGTGTGQVPFLEAARQMALAYRNFLHPPASLDWGLADIRQRQVKYGGTLGFQIPPLV